MLAVWLGFKSDFKKRNCRIRRGFDFVAVVTGDDRGVFKPIV